MSPTTDHEALERGLAVDDETIDTVGAAVMARLFGKRPAQREHAGPRRRGDYVLDQKITVDGAREAYLGHHHVSGRPAWVVTYPADPERDNPVAQLGAVLVGALHDNIVPVLDAWADDDAQHVVWAEPPALDVRAWGGARPRRWSEVVDVFRGVARGLCFAHQKGVVHGELRPSAIRIADDGRPALVNFRAPDPAGALRGYMAPEMIRGGSAEPAADQFGFCVALYESLCGARPFRGPTVVSLLTRISSGVREPVPEHIRLPSYLLRVIDRGLAPDPSQRYPSMAALLVALDRSRMPWWRRRAGWLLAAVVGVLAVVAGAWAVG